MKRNPHNILTRDAPAPVDFWRCHYCQAAGTLAELSLIECSFIYAPCQFCDETPLCAPDCKGVFAALDSAAVFIAGDGKNERFRRPADPIKTRRQN